MQVATGGPGSCRTRQQHELWLQALQPQYHTEPQLPQGLGSPQVSLCHCSLCFLQPGCVHKAPVCPRSGLSTWSTQGAGTLKRGQPS